MMEVTRLYPCTWPSEEPFLMSARVSYLSLGVAKSVPCEHVKEKERFRQ